MSNFGWKQEPVATVGSVSRKVRLGSAEAETSGVRWLQVAASRRADVGF